MDSISNYFNNLTPESIGIFIVTTLLILFSIIINFKVKRLDPLAPPKGIMIVLEMIVEGINNLSGELFGEEKRKIYAPLLLTLTLIILTNILLGFFKMPVSLNNFWVCFGLGITTFLWIQTTAIITRGPLNYLMEFIIIIKVKRWPTIINIIVFLPILIPLNALLLPFNLIGEVSLPISMSLRLFGNLLSGTLILMLVYFGIEMIIDLLGPAGYIALVIASVLHLIFDIAFGAIQIYVFVLLTAIFVSQKLPEKIKN